MVWLDTCSNSLTAAFAPVDCIFVPCFLDNHLDIDLILILIFTGWNQLITATVRTAIVFFDTVDYGICYLVIRQLFKYVLNMTGLPSLGFSSASSCVRNMLFLSNGSLRRGY